MPEINITAYQGFCFGVERAVNMLDGEVCPGKNVYCVGDIIHNAAIISDFCSRGVIFVKNDEVEKIPEGSTVLIRAHGTIKSIYDFLSAGNYAFKDATCPYVRKIHQLASSLSKEEVFIFMGDSSHPEVEGITSFCQAESHIFKSFSDLKKFCESTDLSNKSLVLAAQTTFSEREWAECQKFIKYLYTNVKIFDTICKVTAERQNEVMRLSKTNDLCVIIGGRKSSNTTKLYQIAKENCEKTICIESAEELSKIPVSLFSDTNNIGITAGASTPGSIIQEVVDYMTDITRDDMSFEEMLNESFRTLTTGERVTGIISAVSQAEIHVDMGTKHTGILPFDEITDDNSVDLVAEYNVGDPIEVVCIKFSDSEGTVLLSKKRLDQKKHWAVIEEAANDNATLTGTVKDIIKGGVIVFVNSIKVFVPASQSGLPREASLDQLKGQKVSLKIIEVNNDRKRAVGSIRNATREDRRQQTAEFLETLEPGMKFKGTVRSLTNYGAFVSIGPVDGMVHISELSWGRLKPPAEVLSVGEEIDVFIKSLSEDKKRISLGYKTEENNPWKIFLEKFKVEDIVDTKIVSCMPFGAFAEIIPGVDGLIHISQISLRSIPSPSSVLKVGDTLKVKITAIDEEKQRISLSYRAMIEEFGAEDLAAGKTFEKPVVEEASAEDVARFSESKEEEAPTEIEAIIDETPVISQEEAVETETVENTAVEVTEEAGEEKAEDSADKVEEEVVEE